MHILYNDNLFSFCSKFPVQSAVMENGLLLCLIDFLVQKKISPQVMKVGRLYQEKMKMNLDYTVIAVALKKTKNYLFRKGMFNIEIYCFKNAIYHIQMLSMLLNVLDQ